jgi:hypothetical protein
LLLEIDTLLDENSSHGYQVFVRAEMLILNFFIVVTEIVFGASNDSKVWRGLLGQSDWNLHSCKLGVVLWILHLLEDDTLLHLPDILLFNNSE